MSDYNLITDSAIAALSEMIGAERISTRHADLDQHARDQSFHASHAPEVVIWPESTSHVSQVLRYANGNRIPVTAWGVGSSLEGNPIAVHGGILLDFGRMNQIVKIRAEDFQVDVQPGITRVELNKALARYGLFFPPDPGANATIGGMIGNNAAGIKTIRYGATKDNVMHMEVVKADGEILRVGSRARKDSSGYDLLHLFIGSEGTLGIVTEATLKLTPLPSNFSAVLAAFEGIEPAMHAVVDIVGAALNPSALEFLDVETVRTINRDRGISLPEATLLVMEFNGASDDEGLNEAVALCKENGAVSFQTARGLEERNRLWDARHHTYESIVRSHPNQAQIIVDVAVPLSQYPALVLFVDQTLRNNEIYGYKLGHAGDGNLHVNILYDPKSPPELELAQNTNAQIVEYAISLEGTATGEHGVGIGKRKYIVKQHGAALEMMRQIKTLFDPNGILNPGKIFL